jgi:predicted MarR family transcription regulator
MTPTDERPQVVGAPNGRAGDLRSFTFAEITMPSHRRPTGTIGPISGVDHL